MPLPVFLVVKKGRKMSWRSASGTPVPLSPTSIRVRPDRIASFEPTGEIFVETNERGLNAYLGRVGGESDGIF